ncbi:unnamed protein product [Cuscuta epithymum]|uniref:Uncharacterized protein n=1 Tax=Cuscuta epithymum TaxID=186058 RepID=A0AAV0DCM4_9ASTE|nr:unnamed protein product [Cuscuta epithymum]
MSRPASSPAVRSVRLYPPSSPSSPAVHFLLSLSSSPADSIPLSLSAALRRRRCSKPTRCCSSASPLQRMDVVAKMLLWFVHLFKFELLLPRGLI